MKKIENKMAYSKQLFQFLEQAKTENLKTKHFDGSYYGLKVKVSFGQGVPARIPWISFLKTPNKTSNGIYPVYLLYKEHDILILAYGISETSLPEMNWNIKSDTIKEYFKDHQLGSPQRYGASYVFKTYEINNLPEQTEIDRDLIKIIQEYNNVMMNNSTKLDFTLKKELSSEILSAFKKWYDSSNHKDNEDFYKNIINFENIKNKSDDELIKFFVQFKKDGGKIQSTDNRLIDKFEKVITNLISDFREFILAPFSPDFDELKWLNNLKKFKHFGIGTATIYLNRVDKNKYHPFNNKARDAFNLISSKKLPTSETKAYSIVSELSRQMIELYDCFNNYFQTDAFTQFIIGEKEGKILISEWLKIGLIEEKPFVINNFLYSLDNSGLIFSKRTISRFISSLLTKPFVILSGLSGSGKTKLAQAFAQWICQDDTQYCIVQVGADWTNREPLLGFPNALKPDEYIKPDNGVLDVVIRANNNPDLPYFLILDEMNLSHVERYFADFLSVMESHEEIPLFAEGTVNNGVPSKLLLPSNLFIIGTVNIDETTYMFSPKVLDRANTIEFRVTKSEIEDFLENHKEVEMSELFTKGASMAKSFLDMAQNKDFEKQDMKQINASLADFFEQLKKTGAEFGYRSANEIIRLINQLTEIDDSLNNNEKLDIAIMQKLLPKLHGSRRKLSPVLITLGGFCIDNEKIKNIEKEIFGVEDFDFNSSEKVKYPLSLEKIARMYKGAIDNGFASYAEA